MGYESLPCFLENPVRHRIAQDPTNIDLTESRGRGQFRVRYFAVNWNKMRELERRNGMEACCTVSLSNAPRFTG